MQCPNCGHDLLPAKNDAGFCAACQELFSKEQIDRATQVIAGSKPSESPVSRGANLLPLIPKLPSTLAIMLDEYVRETNDYIALHAMCATLEMTARFLTIVVLADVWRHIPPNGDFSERLIEQLSKSLTNPTLGAWKYLLTAAIKELPDAEASKVCFLPELPAYAKRFDDELGGGKDAPEQKLLAMRNQLAHGGRISEEMTTRFLQAHSKRFEKLMLGLAFLADDQGVKLVASPAAGRARWLRGLPDAWKDFNRADLPEYFQQAGSDRILLVTSDGVLDLFPLHAYGEIFHVEKNTLVGKGEEAIHIFSRREQPSGMTYTAIGSRDTYSRGQPTWEDRFADIFKLEAWRARMYVEGALKRYTFARRMDELLDLFIGREEQVSAAAQRIAATESGILWLGGKPGMGKSAFMAKLVRDYFDASMVSHDARSAPPKSVIIPYFFQLSDGDKCRMASFLEAALLHLRQAGGHSIEIESDPQKRVVQFNTALRDFVGAGAHQKIIFFVDGLDEIAGIDPEFVNLVFACQLPDVVWVCAGREEGILAERFTRDRCRWLFACDSPYPALRVVNEADEGLLPPLNEENARGFLIEELGHQVKTLFERDKQQNGEWTNEFLAALIRRSEGLPLYLRHLVQDIRAGRFDFTSGSEQKLPQGLTAYYDQLVAEMGDDLKATVPAITTLLAVAKEPLPVETLAALLADHELVGQDDGRALLDEALRFSSSMLRQAPTSAGTLGYALYHTSFKQHVLHSEQIRRSRVKALSRLCQLAINWRPCKPNVQPLDYALRFGPAHLTEEAKWEAVESLLTDLRFIEAKCAAGMT